MKVSLTISANASCLICRFYRIEIKIARILHLEKMLLDKRGSWFDLLCFYRISIHLSLFFSIFPNLCHKPAEVSVSFVP